MKQKAFDGERNRKRKQTKETMETEYLYPRAGFSLALKNLCSHKFFEEAKDKVHQH